MYGSFFLYTTKWPLIPRILSTNSVLNPFITDITTIRVATPNIIPINENQAEIDIKPSTRLDLIYLNAIICSVWLKNKNFTANLLIIIYKIY